MSRTRDQKLQSQNLQSWSYVVSVAFFCIELGKRKIEIVVYCLCCSSDGPNVEETEASNVQSNFVVLCTVFTTWPPVVCYASWRS